FTASRTGLPAYIQSAVTRCERYASYAATIPKTPTSPIGFHCLIQRVGEAAKMPFSIHPHMLRHACGFKLANETFSTRSGTPKWRRTASRIFGANWRRQARDRFPLDYLGIRRRVPLGNHLFDDLDAALDLLGAHRLDAAGMLQLHLPRHQQGADLH